MVDSISFAGGKDTSIKISQGEEMTIEFPVSVNEVKMSGKVNIRNASQDNFVFEDYTGLEGIEQISCA